MADDETPWVIDPETGEPVDDPTDSGTTAWVGMPEAQHSALTIEGYIEGIGNLARGANQHGGPKKRAVQVVFVLVYGSSLVMGAVALLAIVVGWLT